MPDHNTENELYRLMGGIASDTKHILAKLTDHNAQLNRQAERISTLEAKGNRLLGMASAISFVLPVIIIGIKTFIIGE